MRCAVCGSKRVTKETKKEGYNTKNGVIGTILFGIPGTIIGGASGNNVNYYHCADCGHVLNSLMDFSTEMRIDKYLEYPEDYEKELKKEKEKYPNIKWIEPDIKELYNKEPDRAKKIFFNILYNIGKPVTARELIEKTKLSLEEIEMLLYSLEEKVGDTYNEFYDEYYFCDEYYYVIGQHDNKYNLRIIQEKEKQLIEEKAEIVFEIIYNIGKPAFISEIYEKTNSMIFDESQNKTEIIEKCIDKLIADGKIKKPEENWRIYYVFGQNEDKFNLRIVKEKIENYQKDEQENKELVLKILYDIAEPASLSELAEKMNEKIEWKKFDRYLKKLIEEEKVKEQSSYYYVVGQHNDEYNLRIIQKKEEKREEEKRKKIEEKKIQKVEEEKKREEECKKRVDIILKELYDIKYPVRSKKLRENLTLDWKRWRIWYMPKYTDR